MEVLVGHWVRQHTSFHSFHEVLVFFISLDVVIMQIDELDQRDALFYAFPVRPQDLREIGCFVCFFEEYFVELQESVGIFKNEAEALDNFYDFLLAVLDFGHVVAHIEETLGRVG